MQAIILAAGMGRRLGKLTANDTKCMVRLGGVPIIDRMISQIISNGINKITLVVGYKADHLIEHLSGRFPGVEIGFIRNTIYDKTNNIYSLSLAKDLLMEDDTILLESDLVFEDGILERILDNDYPDLALVDKYESWMDGTVVKLGEDNTIVNFISKKAFDFGEADKYYKTVNIYKFSKSFSRGKYVPFLEAYCKSLGNNEYYEQVLKVISLLDNPQLKALMLDGEKWYEIDDIQDLDIAEALFAEDRTRLSKYYGRYGGYWRFPDMLDFCYLVNPYFPTQRMENEMAANFGTLLREYPSGMKVNSMLAERFFGLDSGYVCVGNGAAELIKAVMECSDCRIGVSLPTFEEYPNRTHSDPVLFHPGNRDFSYSADDLMDYFEDKGIGCLLVINPDNPSGNFIPVKDILRLCKWAEDKAIRLIVDESFVDFSEGGRSNSLLNDETLSAYPSLMVVKSISKSYGVPGLRLGVLASGDREFVATLKKAVPIWNINSFAEFFMQIFSKYENDYDRACGQFVSERKRFAECLEKIPFLRVVPSQANYFLCEVLDMGARELTERLLNSYDILIKDCSTKKGVEGKNYVRIAIRNSADNDRLVKALEDISGKTK